MGGMSFKCPMCNKWYLAKGPLKDHLKDKHQVINVRIEGVGSHVELVKG
jgi:hypothetical protein